MVWFHADEISRTSKLSSGQGPKVRLTRVAIATCATDVGTSTTTLSQGLQKQITSSTQTLPMMEQIAAERRRHELYDNDDRPTCSTFDCQSHADAQLFNLRLLRAVRPSKNARNQDEFCDFKPKILMNSSSRSPHAKQSYFENHPSERGTNGRLERCLIAQLQENFVAT
eukprot:1470758-Pleurochrysis_carterae.AAC.1